MFYFLHIYWFFLLLYKILFIIISMFQILLLLALIGYIWNQIFYAPYSRKYDGLSVSFYRSIFLSIIMLPLVYLWDFSGVTPSVFFILLGLWFIWAYWVIIQFQSYKYLPVWIVSSIMNSYNIIVLLLWYFVYQEMLSISGYIGLILIMISSTILGISKSNFSHLDPNYYKGVILIILRVFTYAIWIFGFSYYARELEPMSVAYLSELTVLLGFIPFVFFRYFQQ